MEEKEVVVKRTIGDVIMDVLDKIETYTWRHSDEICTLTWLTGVSVLAYKLGVWRTRSEVAKACIEIFVENAKQ